MRAALLSTVAAVLIGFVGVASVSALTGEQAVPDRATDFQLTDTTRFAHTLSYYKYAPAIVLMSQINGSKLSRDAAAELAKLQAAYKDKGVPFFMINSNPSDTRDAAAAEAAKYKFSVPVLMDEVQLVGERLGVQREGEVFVLNPKDSFRIAYHGPLDSRFTQGAPNLKARAKDMYAARAIDAVLAGQTVANPRVNLKVGQTIAFPERGRAALHATISYSQEIAPILRAKCVTCHQKGGIGPFQMSSYEVVKGFAPMMREAVMTKRMPPWFADPHVGTFANDTSLSPEQTKTLVHWIEAGAPRGEGEDILRTQASEAPEWPVALGKPDVIVKLPAFSVPASGIVEYQNIKVDNPFKADVWVRAVAFKPGARTVLHHVTSNYVLDPSAPPPKIQGSFVGAYVPGGECRSTTMKPASRSQRAGPLPTRCTIPPPARRRPTSRRSAITFGRRRRTLSGALLISPTPASAFQPAKPVERKSPIWNSRGCRALHASPARPFPRLSGRTHCKDARGAETPLLSLPKYDFNWQLDYELAQPLKIKAGTKLVVRFTYDNSEHNKANPIRNAAFSGGSKPGRRCCTSGSASAGG